MTWIATYLSDPSNRATLYRCAIALTGYLTSQGWMPKPISDLIYSLFNNPALMGTALALLIKAGDKNPK